MDILEVGQESATEAQPELLRLPEATGDAASTHAGVAPPEVVVTPADHPAPEPPASKMRALVEAGIVIAAELSLDTVLQRIVEIGRGVLQARYAALGVAVEGTTRLERFVTAGVSAETEARIGRLPEGGGILGALQEMDEPLRMRDLTTHPLFAGFPAGHPQMRSLIGVPLTAHGRTFGSLYFAEKIGAPQFTDEDESLACSLAAQAAVAIENARLFAALQDEHRAAVQAQRMGAIGSLASVIGHELRNPLSVINNAIFFLGTKLAKEDTRVARHLEIIRQEIRKATRIIENLLDFSRVRPPQPAPTAIRMLLRDAVVRRQLPESVRVEEELPPDLPRITVDPSQMGQALACLVANAVEAMPEGGTLRLQAGVEGGRAIIRVGDTGEGIPAENLARIFEPLFTTRQHGVGLGLALVQRVVAAHGGSVQVESREGEGTTVTVSVPVTPPA